MSNRDAEVKQLQEEDQRQKLELGGAYEEMVRTRGWEFIKTYYQAQVNQFANSMLMSDQKPTAEFDIARRELIGIRKLLGHVNESLRYLESYRKEQDGK